MKKAGFMKDAFVLFLITLFAGFALGGVYQITKAPIAEATLKANEAAYRAVFSQAEKFNTDEALMAAIGPCNEALAGMSYGNVSVENVLRAVDGSGNELGYVITAVSNDSYGGAVKLSIGLMDDGTVTGVEFLEINDTPGLGLKAKEAPFISQFNEKNVSEFTVIKSGTPKDSEIVSISGATITSSATANAVNAALYYLHNCIAK